MKKSSDVENFIKNHRNLYNLAIMPEKEMPKMEKGIINVIKQKIISSKGVFKGYCFSFGGKEVRIENFEDVEKYLAELEYKEDYKQSSYPYKAFVNLEKQKQYNNTIDEIRQYNKSISDAAKKLINETEEMLKNYDETYIRFGQVPDNERSYNFREEILEDGVSCFSAVKVDDKYVVDIVGGMFTYLGYMDNGKTVYELSGKKIGKGGDGEPLLREVKVIQEINPDNLYTIKELICNLFDE